MKSQVLFYQKRTAPLLSDNIIERRLLVIQQVIDLTAYHGEHFLNKIEKLNSSFEPNSNSRIIPLNSY